MEKLKPGFVWTLRSFDKDDRLIGEEKTHNLMPIEALDYMLSCTFKEGSQYPSFYVGLYEGIYTPQPLDVMATFPTLANELTAYTSSTRPLLVLGDVADGNVDNSASETEFIGTTDGKVAVGGFISTAQAKGGTTGVLLSAVKFPTSKTLNSASRLEVLVAFQFISV